MKIEKAERLKKLPPYLFAEIDKAKRKAKSEGRDIIDLGVGDPDQPTPRHIIEKLSEAAFDPANHHYALDAGMPALRQAIAAWYKKRFDVELEPDKEILPLIGSKEGLTHLPLGVINPRDIVLIPEPCYPAYRSAVIFAGGNFEHIPLLEENQFLPQFAQISPAVIKKTKLLYLNYPHNPTGAVADLGFFASAVKFAQKHGIILVQDAAYSEVAYDGFSMPSILQIEGAKDIAVEFHSLSKTYNMTGWRIGWVCGNSDVIACLAQVKANVDSGIFQAVQIAGIAALNSPPIYLEKLNALYHERRDILVQELSAIGWKIPKPQATFYMWVRLPQGYSDSLQFARLLLEKADVIVTPGIGFGPSGEGYIRIALTVSRDRLKEAVERIRKAV
ncbi:MAG: LL-diaminopimelate aminotransferase [Candidatus Omnitrophota bacterium]